MENISDSQDEFSISKFGRNIRIFLLFSIFSLVLAACDTAKPINAIETSKIEEDIPEIGEFDGLIPVSGIIMQTYHQWIGPLKWHTGYDIQNEIGTDVIAPLDGKIIYTQPPDEPSGSIGINVDMLYGDPRMWCTISFGHLSDYVVTQGQEIKKGDLIGHLGDTGLKGEFPPHLHLEGSCLNPTAGYIDLAKIIPGLQFVGVGDFVSESK